MSGHVLTRAVKQHPKAVLFFTLLLPLMLLILLLKSAGAGQTQAPPKRPDLQRVEVLQIKHQEQYQRTMNIVGRVESGEQTILGFERGGTLANVLVEEGQVVKRGELLAELDVQRLQAQLQEVNAAVKRAQADARLAELSEKRIQQLVKDKLESPQRLDEARESTQAAEALVDEMLARRFSTQVEFQKSKIIAPFSGVITTRHVDDGSVVAQGQPIFELLRDGALQVRMAMPADDALRFTPGQKQTLYRGHQKLTAEVISVGGRRDIRTRTVDVMMSLQVPSEKWVLQGDLLSLQLDKTVDANGFWVPKSALTSSIRGMWSVFSVSQPGEEQGLKSLNVNVLYSESERVFVTGPIRDEDYIVANGVHRLVPQQLVVATLASESLIAGQ